MEQELLQELDKGEQLSHLFSRKVTLEAFRCLSLPSTEQQKRKYKPSSHFYTARCFRTLSELEPSTASLVLEVADAALKLFLGEPERWNKSEAASAEIGKVLAQSVAPCLSV